MKKQKVVLYFSLMLMLALVITACGSSQSKQEPAKEANQESSEKQEPQEAKVIKLAHVVNEKDGFHVAAEKFKELVEQQTDGQVKIEIYPNAVLGDERTLIEGMQTGVVDMGVITNGPIANFLPDMAVFEMPFLFASPEEAYKILDGEVGQEVLNKLEAINIKGLAYA